MNIDELFTVKTVTHEATVAEYSGKVIIEVKMHGRVVHTQIMTAGAFISLLMRDAGGPG